MAGISGIPIFVIRRFGPTFLQPFYARQSHRGLQTIFRRCCSTSKTDKPADSLKAKQVKQVKAQEPDLNEEMRKLSQNITKLNDWMEKLIVQVKNQGSKKPPPKS